MSESKYASNGQRRIIGKRTAKVPNPRILTGDELAALQVSLIAGTLTKDQAWSMFHLLVLTLHVQGDLIKHIVAQGADEKETRALMKEHYAKRIKEYTESLLAVHEPEQSARPS